SLSVLPLISGGSGGQGERQGSAMAAPNTYAVHLSSETHKIEAWCESDEALAKQLQEEEDSLATREFAGSVSLEPSSPAVEYRPANNAAQVATEDNVDPDNMSYEQLQAIGEEVGTQSRGLSDDLISYLEPFRNKCNFFSCKKNTDEYVTVSFILNRSSFCNPRMNILSCDTPMQMCDLQIEL
uniref:Uncharacterized protein n=2 Tax=Aegilops tauschii subsp. strangulata TaxID=200361 RepID=A0A453LDD7_AEGTS